jgi:hypothetical protein
MANFSTEFPLDVKNTVEDVVRLACAWITGSPHTKIHKEAFAELPSDAEVTTNVDGEQVTIATAKQSDYEIGGLRYVKTEANFAWTTSIVSRKSATEHMLSLQVVCEALNTAAHLPPPRKPYFIRQVLAELGGGTDGEIPVTDKPFFLNKGEAHVAAALMLGTAHNRLPIIYVSAGFDGSHSVDPNDLAKYVSGLAHVIVEPTRAFSNQLKILASARNVYGGGIGVYWPESSARKSYFVGPERRDARAIEVQIVRDIQAALSNRRLRTNCTWSHLMETVARKRFDALRGEGSTDLEEYIAAFDSDMSAKDARLSEADQEISRLNAEIRRLSANSQSAGRGVLIGGAEQDLYDHEIADFVSDALQESLRGALAGSRRAHVMRDLLEANADSGARHKLSDEVKALLRGYRDMDSRTKAALVRLGFDISEDGKHYKAVFQGDGRYTFSVPKTSSDGRAGLNLASDINKQLF